MGKSTMGKSTISYGTCHKNYASEWENSILQQISCTYCVVIWGAGKKLHTLNFEIGNLNLSYKSRILLAICRK
jgi:hypothetical protein